MAEGSVPVPDPTLLTTQNLLREIGALKELMNVEMLAMDRRVTEISTYSKARGEDIKAAAATLQSFLEEKIARNTEVAAEKFKGIETQFSLNSTALIAAFAANKELNDSQTKSNSLAVSKSEVATSDALKQLAAIGQAENKAMKEQIDDLKEAMSLIRGAHSGAKDFWGYVIGALGVAVAVGTLVVLVMRH